jgi:hypothetical protein
MKTLRLFLLLSILLLTQTGFSQNPRNILIDDLTSTMCGHCPCMDTVLQQVILKQHPNTVIMAIHGSMSAYKNNDFFPLIDSLGFDSDGAACVNRMGLPSVVEVIADTVNARYARMPESPVKMEIISKIYDPVSRFVTIVVKSTAMQPGMNGIYRINAAILESNLIGFQEHFPECPGGDNYNHRFVLRAMNFIPVGDILINGNWAQQTSVTRTFSMDVDEDWVESNCDVILYIDKMQGPLNISPIQQSIKQGVTRPMGVEPIINSSTAIVGIFPNPVHGSTNIHLRIAETGSAKVVLIDINGKIVKILTEQKLSAGLYNLELDASGIPAGNYFIRMDLNSQVYSKKIQIQ